MEELAERGVIGFKAFMCPSGIDDFLWADEETLGRGMEIAARLKLPVAVHAEDPEMTTERTRNATACGQTTFRDYFSTRPIDAEVVAIRKACRKNRRSLHIVHVSSGRGVQAVLEARRRGEDVTCETCPHYLVLTDAEALAIGPAAKCAPPLRSAAQRDLLWDHLKAKRIDFVASDHSPSPWSMKESSNFLEVWGGIAGCQSTLGLMLAEGYACRGFALSEIADVIADEPAKRYRLPGKGRVETGFDADFSLVDLAGRHTLKTEDLRYRHRISPYVGREHAGTVRRTYVRGRAVCIDGEIIGPPAGHFLRPQA
jgi:allantoinase